MKPQRLITCLILMLLIASCSVKTPLDQVREITLEPFAATSMAGVSYNVSGDQITIQLTRANRSGSYFELSLPSDTAIQNQQWADDGTIGLAVPTDTGAQIGVVALATYNNTPITVELALVTPEKAASKPPTGEWNRLTDLAIADAGPGTIELSWTARNLGDYDGNSEVGISDLTPLGLNFATIGPFTPNQAGYWVDGDGNGEVGISDITPIGANFLNRIGGYNVWRNGELVEVVNFSSGETRYPLPNFFRVTLPGNLADSWAVYAIDLAGTEGAGGEINGVATDVTATLSITGMNLLDTMGANPAPLGEKYYLTRIIDPIEIIGIARSAVPSVVEPALVSGTTVEFAAVPRDRWLYLDLVYLPEFDLATGAPRETSGARQMSAVPPEDFVITSVPFRLPGGGQVNIDAQVNLLDNPLGGFFVELETLIEMPGDNPVTPVLENGYTLASTTRLDYLNGVVSSDTDDNGGFDDEAELEDEDRDCVSLSRTDQAIDDDEYEEHGEELEIEGVISAFDEAAGLITLVGAAIEGGGPALPDPLVLHFSELTRFEEKIKTDGDDIEQDIDPSDLQAGDEVEVELYRLDDGTGALPDKYWIEKIDRRIDLTG